MDRWESLNLSLWGKVDALKMNSISRLIYIMRGFMFKYLEYIFSENKLCLEFFMKLFDSKNIRQQCAVTESNVTDSLRSGSVSFFLYTKSQIRHLHIFWTLVLSFTHILAGFYKSLLLKIGTYAQHDSWPTRSLIIQIGLMFVKIVCFEYLTKSSFHIRLPSANSAKLKTYLLDTEQLMNNSFPLNQEANKRQFLNNILSLFYQALLAFL